MRGSALGVVALALVSITRPAPAAVSFVTRADFPTGLSPTAVAVGRFNRDDLPDLVVADGGGLSLFLGTGRGGLSSPLRVRLASAPDALATADLNGDRRTDIATVSRLAPEVRILHGDGEGGVGVPVSHPTGPHPHTIVAADVDHDRRPDLVIGHAEGLTIYLARDGDRPTPHHVATGHAVRAIAVGDVDRDGVADLLVLDAASDHLAVWRGTGTGEFTLSSRCVAGTSPRALVTHDFDADGALDLAVIDDVGLAVFRGDGHGTFKPPRRIVQELEYRDLVAGDFNRDGTPDLAALDPSHGSVIIWTPDFTGAFLRSAMVSVGNGATRLAVLDATADGWLDIVSVNRSSDSITLVRGDGHGGWAGPTVVDGGTTPVALALADFTGDRHLDLAVADEDDSTLRLFVGDGRGGFRLRSSQRVGAQARALLPVDLDADRRTDLVVADFPADRVAVLASTAEGHFGTARYTAVGAGPVALVSADFDNDGHADVAVANTVGNTVSILYGDGHGGLPRLTTFPVVRRPSFLMTGNLDSDQWDDLIVGNGRDDSVSILKGQAGGLAAPTDGTMGKTVRPLVSDDFDRDGRLDLALTDETGDAIEILPGVADQSFGRRETFAVGRRPVAVSAGDVNGDGLPDLAVLNRGSRSVVVLLNNSTRGTAPAPLPATVPPAAADPWGAAAQGGLW